MDLLEEEGIEENKLPFIKMGLEKGRRKDIAKEEQEAPPSTPSRCENQELDTHESWCGAKNANMKFSTYASDEEERMAKASIEVETRGGMVDKSGICYIIKEFIGFVLYMHQQIPHSGFCNEVSVQLISSLDHAYEQSFEGAFYPGDRWPIIEGSSTPIDDSNLIGVIYRRRCLAVCRLDRLQHAGARRLQCMSTDNMGRIREDGPLSQGLEAGTDVILAEYRTLAGRLAIYNKDFCSMPCSI
eukprot:Gb_12701 [translate_table: standard]